MVLGRSGFLLPHKPELLELICGVVGRVHLPPPPPHGGPSSNFTDPAKCRPMRPNRGPISTTLGRFLPTLTRRRPSLAWILPESTDHSTEFGRCLPGIGQNWARSAALGPIIAMLGLSPSTFARVRLSPLGWHDRALERTPRRRMLDLHETLARHSIDTILTPPPPPGRYLFDGCPLLSQRISTQHRR